MHSKRSRVMFIHKGVNIRDPCQCIGMGPSPLQWTCFRSFFGPIQEQHKGISVITLYTLISILSNGVLTLLFNVYEYYFLNLVFFGALATTIFGLLESPTNHLISDLVLHGHERCTAVEKHISVIFRHMDFLDEVFTRVTDHHMNFVGFFVRVFLSPLYIIVSI